MVHWMYKIHAVGGVSGLEHPKDPGCEPYPSIWVLSLVVEMLKYINAVVVNFPQCMLGASALKLTTITRDKRLNLAIL